jgi:pilus assembly protein CpaF
VAIKDLLGKRTETVPAKDSPVDQSPGRSPDKVDAFYDIKRKIHSRLVEEANLAALDTLDPAEIRREIENVVDYYLREENALPQRCRAQRPDHRDPRRTARARAA